MKEIKFQYKCRKCGEVYTGGRTGEEGAQVRLTCEVFGHPIPERHWGEEPRLLGVHHCKNGQGVADLIGYEVVK